MRENYMLTNGLVSHAFAATMAAVVLLFPTPTDLWHSFSERDVVIDQKFPISLTPDTGISEMHLALDYCTENFAKLLPVHVIACQTVIFQAADRLDVGAGERPEIERLKNQLGLAVTVYCRELWAEARQFEEAFDPAECQLGLTRLAQSI